VNRKKPNQEGLLEPSQLTYARILRTKLEDLPALESDLEAIFERHRIAVISQQTSVRYLRIVEELFLWERGEGP
jgi:hypothetical protein